MVQTPRRIQTASYLAALVVLGAASLPAQAPSGCLKGSVFMPLGFNGTIKVCPEYNAQIPDLQKQLDSLQKTLAGNQLLLAELQHSVRSVNSVAKDVDEDRKVELLRSFQRELTASVTADQQKTQAQIASLSDKLDALQEIIAAKESDDKTARQTQAALEGRLGDAIAALDLTKAKSQLDSIEAKLDTIESDLKCNSATAEDMRLALKARILDRVRFILGCRPEIAGDEPSWQVAEQLFDPDKFSQSRDFLEGLWKTPLIASAGVCPFAHEALYNGNFDGMEWILRHSSAEKVQRCERFAQDLIVGLYMPCSLGCSGGKERVQGYVARFKEAGLKPELDEHRLFRLAYQDYLTFLLVQTPGVVRSVSQEYPTIFHTLQLAAGEATFFGPRYMGYWENAGFKWESDALAPENQADFLRAKAAAEAELKRNYSWVPAHPLARSRSLEYCPEGRAYCLDSGAGSTGGGKSEMVHDRNSGLTWTAKASEHPLTWDDATKYCARLNLGGYRDWRLPNLDELQGLYDPAESESAVCPWLPLTPNPMHVRLGIQAGCNAAWSGRRDVKTGKLGNFIFDQAWTFNFVSGKSTAWNIDWMGYEEPMQTLCVRGTRKPGSGTAN